MVSLDLFRAHVAQPADATADVLLESYLRQAEEMVVNFITRADDEDQAATIAAWDEETVPASVQAAVLRQAAELWRFRGDDETAPTMEYGEIAPQVANILIASGYRRPVIA